MSGKESDAAILTVDGLDVRVSSPDRVYFSERGETKLDLARYYASVGEGIVRAGSLRRSRSRRIATG